MDIQQIGIQVRDIEKSIRFYQKLGFLLIEKSLPDRARLKCGHQGPLIVLHASQNVGEGTWVYLEVPALEEAVQKLEQKGIHFREPPQKKTWVWEEAWLDDMDGNHIVLYSKPEKGILPPWKVH